MLRDFLKYESNTIEMTPRQLANYKLAKDCFGKNSLNKHPLEAQLIAYELIKWQMERNIKAVKMKIDRRIKQFGKDFGGYNGQNKTIRKR